MKHHIIFFVTIQVALTALKDYTKYQIIKVTPTPETVSYLVSLASKEPRIDIINGGSANKNDSMDVLIEQTFTNSFRKTLRARTIAHKVIKSNVQRLLNKAEAGHHRRPFKSPQLHPRSFPHDEYHTLDEIYSYLASIYIHYSNMTQLIDIGKSYEGRSMYVLKISFNKSAKNGIWIDGGQHGREWISPAVILYIIDQLISNSTYSTYLDDTAWYFLPVSNPDGFSYTWTDDRLWRKTRTKYPQPKKKSWWDPEECAGADPNRNWDIDWRPPRLNVNACSNGFPGTKPFSEPSVKNIARFLRAHKNEIQAFLNLHSYGQFWFYPYGYKQNTYPDDVEDLKRVSQEATEAIKQIRGTTYRVGTPAGLLYEASGSGMDWAKQVLGIKYAFGLELPPSQKSFFGFRLPAYKIIPAGEEVLAGILKVAEAVQNLTLH